jgi:hypothetical protein
MVRGVFSYRIGTSSVEHRNTDWHWQGFCRILCLFHNKVFSSSMKYCLNHFSGNNPIMLYFLTTHASRSTTTTAADTLLLYVHKTHESCNSIAAINTFGVKFYFAAWEKKSSCARCRGGFPCVEH